MATVKGEEVLARLEQLKYSPSSIINLGLSVLDEVLEGKYDIVDASNPFIYLLENSSLNTAFAIQEYLNLLKKQYPRLASNEQELYLHMSDYDYLGRFSEPAFGNVVFMINYTDFHNKAKYDFDTKTYTLKIPRNMRLKVGNYSFMLPYAVILTEHENGVIDVKFDPTLTNTIYQLNTNHIQFDTINIYNDEKYITFTVTMPEINIDTTEVTIVNNQLINNTMGYDPSKKFYWFEAYYVDQSGNWKPFVVTHTDTVMDPDVPTISIKVYQDTNEVEYYISPIYKRKGLIGNKVKLLLYTTNGYIDEDFSSFKLEEFKTDYAKVFPDLELDDTTAPLNVISKVVFIKDKIVGGKDAIPFDELKNKVIDNAIGDRKLPITDKQIEHEISQRNFRRIKQLDTITKREFSLELNILKPEGIDGLYSEPLFDQMEFVTTPSSLAANPQVIQISPTKFIIPKGTYFKYSNGTIKLLTEAEVNEIKNSTGISLTTLLNNKRYIETYYDYVLDFEEDVDKIRAFELYKPTIKQINFKNYNPKSLFRLNTVSADISKTSNGYEISIVADFKKFSDIITQANLKCYIFYKKNDSRFFVPVTLYSALSDNQYLFKTTLETNGYVSDNNEIYFTNFVDVNNSPTNVYIDSETELGVLFLSTYLTDTTGDDSQNYISSSFLAIDHQVVAYEEYKVVFAHELKYLYKKMHSSLTKDEYQKYETDVYETYQYHVLDDDGNIIHHKGDVVLDEEGSPVIKFKAGDPVLDSNGNPVPIPNEEVQRIITLTVVDSRFVKCTTEKLKQYKDKVQTYLLENIKDNASSIQDELLENTEANVTFRKSIDHVNVKTGDGRVKSIPANQTFVFRLYVDLDVYNDVEMRALINKDITTELYQYLETNTILKKNEFLSLVYDKVKEHVRTFSIEKFTELDTDYIEILTENGRIAIDKIMEYDHEGYSIKENVTFTYNVI